MPWNDTVVDSEILAVHAALVPAGAQGEVVLFGGDEHWSAQQESAGGDRWKKTRVYSVATHGLLGVAVPSPDSDVFCSHHAFAADGRLLIAGGTSKWPLGGDIHGHELDFLGHRRCWIYNPRQRTWNEVARLVRNPDQADEPESGGRWYPGLVTLGNGEVFAAFGHPMEKDFRHRNTLPERYSQPANGWFSGPRQMAFPIEPSGSVRFLFYPRMFLLPDGQLFMATPMPVDFEAAASGDGAYFSTRYDPVSGNYTGHKIPQPSFGGYLDWSRPAVLLPLLPEEDYRPRALFCGDTGAVRIDLGNPTGEWQATAARHSSVASQTRQYSNAVLLPTGDVCVVGGVRVAEPEIGVNVAEVYSPGIDWAAGTYSGTDAWTVDADQAGFTRNYHSVALLLPNGKVWVAGGNVDGHSGNPADIGVRNIELYEPPYTAIVNRIAVSGAPRFAAYGQSFELTLDRPASNVSRVALIRAGSVTHSTNNDQRYVGLAISQRSGNTITVVAPPTGNIAPPGYYMLWVVDNAGNPCQLAPFVRLAHAGCTVTTDRSTFSEEEILSIGGGGQATINDAVYLYFDGLLDSELAGTPTVELAWDDTGAPIPTSALSLTATGRLLERGSDPDVPQRITFPYRIRFADTSLFASVVDRRRIRMTFTLGPFRCSETIDLSKSPNPYMTDIDPALNNPAWLSTDVRVFFTTAGSTRFGVAQGSGAGAPATFLRGVLDRFASAPNDPSHPFLTLAQQQDSQPLVLATDIFGIRFFNYAIAKVRYRANTTVAQRVKVFFRLFNTVGTALQYDTTTTYRHTGPGTGTVPLLGVAGGEIASIPFFLSPRVATVAGEAGASAMTAQTLDASYEIRDITPTPGAEVVMYFACWLDINQTAKRFPIAPGSSNGPWPSASSRSIQELVRGRHQCLVAEVYFEPDPTDAGDTPGTSDNLSQRNLSILFSDNPGPPDTHLVVHTFELRPSKIPALPQGMALDAMAVSPPPMAAAAAGTDRRGRYAPDELLFRWHNLPAEAEVELYFSDVDTAEITRLAGLRLSPAAFTVLDDRTIRFRVADVTWLPVPGGRETHIPALISIRLPPGVVYGQTYRVSAHQVDGWTRQIIGAFELSIPVGQPEAVLEEEVRTLSVLRHVATAIPFGNRWYPIFQRYLGLLATKVDALGGDASGVLPNPDGSGRPFLPTDDGRGQRPCVEGWLISLIAGVGIVAGGYASLPLAAVLLASAVILILLIAARWWRRCCGRIRCAALTHLALGSAVGSAILLLVLLAGLTGAAAPAALGVGIFLTAVAIGTLFVLGCPPDCCDAESDCDETPRREPDGRKWTVVLPDRPVPDTVESEGAAEAPLQAQEREGVDARPPDEPEPPDETPTTGESSLSRPDASTQIESSAGVGGEAHDPDRHVRCAAAKWVDLAVARTPPRVVGR